MDIKTLKDLKFEFGEFHHEWSNNYNGKRYLKIRNFIDKLIIEEPLNQMLQQFVGFRLGSQGFSLTELITSAGLTKDEWDILNNNSELESFNESEIKEIEDYVNALKKK